MNSKLVLIAGFLAVGLPAALAADAKALWAEQCASCHGETGKGDTKIGKRLKLKDYSDAAVQAQLKDEEMVNATLKGVTIDGKQKMKPFADKLSEQDAKDLVALIRSFKS